MQDGLDDFRGLRLGDSVLAQEPVAVLVASGHDPLARGLDAGDEWRRRGVSEARQRRGRLVGEAQSSKLGMADRDFLEVLDTPQIAVHADGPQIERGDAERLRSNLAV